MGIKLVFAYDQNLPVGISTLYATLYLYFNAILFIFHGSK